jgi:two-component system sensor histidine kinase/response regulator
MRVQELASNTLVQAASISTCSSGATTLSQRPATSAIRSPNRLLIGVGNATWMTVLLVGFAYLIIHNGYFKSVVAVLAVVVLGAAAAFRLHRRSIRAISLTHASAARENDLLAAREAAEAALRSKSAFLSQMSHEIRTPMNAILGMADLLNDTALTAEQHKYLSMINNGGALVDLVDDILDFDRIETGNLRLDAASFDLQELVERVAETFAIRAHQKGIELSLCISPGVPTTVVGDVLRLRQVLVNLIGNAVKFTERGEVILKIECVAGGEAGELHFAVSDTGIGIAQDQHEKIFGRYAQADPTIARTYGGSGLGLAIVKQLVGLMGGRVWVASEIGRGSTFNFIARFTVTGHPVAATAPTPNLADARMLIVGATVSSGVALSEMLAASRAKVTQVEDGETAIEEVRRADEEGTPYQFVWSHCRATAIDLDLLRRICAAANGAGRVIPMLTSNDLNVRLPLLRRAGLRTHIIKPVRRTELFDAIRTLICGGEEASVSDPIEDRETFAAPQAEDPAIPTAKLAANAKDVCIKSIEPAEHIGDVRHPSPPLAMGRPLRILVADDSADNRLLIEAFLKKTSAHVDQAENGEVALEKFIARKYDVVLMDIQMPVMDGYTAAKLIREWERKNNATPTPIIALTASVLDEALHKSSDAGCDTHVSKPVRRPVLIAAIREVTANLQPNEIVTRASREAMANS